MLAFRCSLTLCLPPKSTITAVSPRLRPQSSHLSLCLRPCTPVPESSLSVLRVPSPTTPRHQGPPPLSSSLSPTPSSSALFSSGSPQLLLVLPPAKSQQVAGPTLEENKGIKGLLRAVLGPCFLPFLFFFIVRAPPPSPFLLSGLDEVLPSHFPV